MGEKSLIDRSALGKRLRQIRGKHTLSQFADMIGVSHMSVKRYEEGTAMPGIDTLLTISKIGKIDLGRLLTGEPLPTDVRDSQPLHFHIHSNRRPVKSFAESQSQWEPDGSQYISVPLTEGKIAVAMPIIAEEEVIDHILLHIRVLQQASASRNLIACRVQGDSMIPHLNSGDIVVIDRDVDKEQIMENKIYAIYYGEGITAKMLQKDGYHLYLIPLNLAEKIQRVDLRVNDNPIVGLVIGAWRNFEGRII